MNLLLVDDHPIVIEALSAMIANRYNEIHLSTVLNPTELAAALETRSHWDFALVDLNFHGNLAGLSVVQDLSRKLVPVIVLSMHSEPALIRRALDAGASGFVTKVDPSEEIFKSLEAVGSGEVYLSATALLAIRNTRPSGQERLSNREREIVQLVVQGKTSKQIGEQLFISMRTVEVHRKNIMQKLGVKNAAQLVAFVEQHSLANL